MNLIKSCCLFVVFSSFLACTSQVSDVKSVSYTEFVNPFIGTDLQAFQKSRFTPCRAGVSQQRTLFQVYISYSTQKGQVP